MNYLILIIVRVAGIILGSYFARQKGGLISEQNKKKMANKVKILEFLQNNEKNTNNDAEKMLSVSNSTTERYLDELEKDGKLTQHGKIGQSVFYTLKK